MARNKDIRTLVDDFAAQLEAAIEARINGDVAQKFEQLKAEILGGARPSRGGAVSAQPGRRAGRPTPKKADMKPCPLSGEMNAARRFSYLMPQFRSPENLKKFRGWHRRPDDEKVALGVVASAIRATSSDAKPGVAKPSKKKAAKKAGRGKKA